MYTVYDAVPGGESSWEKLSSLAADSGEEAASPKDDYAAITAQLAAVGPAAGTRAKSKRPAATVSTSTLHVHMATVSYYTALSIQITTSTWLMLDEHCGVAYTQCFTDMKAQHRCGLDMNSAINGVMRLKCCGLNAAVIWRQAVPLQSVCVIMHCNCH